MTLLFALACAAPVESDPLAYDAGRTGLEGANGPWGVHLTTTADADPPNDLFVPTDADGAAADVGFAAATIVLLQGGSVVPERYHWLAIHLASRGAKVIVPHHGLDLPALDATAGQRALDAAVEAGTVDPDAPVGIAGHSLGGVMGAAQWADNEAIEGLALLASYPADDTNVEARTSGSVVSIVGTEDMKSTPDDVQAGADRFSLTHAMVKVPGMNHYDWTDDATEGELAGDGSATADRADSRKNVQWALAGWVDSCVTSSVGTWPFYAGAHPDDVVGDPCDLMVMGE